MNNQGLSDCPLALSIGGPRKHALPSIYIGQCCLIGLCIWLHPTVWVCPGSGSAPSGSVAAPSGSVAGV